MFKIDNVVFLKGVFYRIEDIKLITINEGIFGLSDTTCVIRFKNLKRGNRFELTDIHLKQIL